MGRATISEMQPDCRETLYYESGMRNKNEFMTDGWISPLVIRAPCD